MTANPSDNNRRIARNTIMLYIRMLLIMAVTLYTSRIVLNALGVMDYGIYNVVGGIVLLFTFLNGAMSQSTQRFLSYEIGQKGTAKLQEIFSTAMTIHLLIAVIILLFAETLGLWFLNTRMSFPPDRIEAANIVYQCSILAFMTSILQVPYNATIIAHERMQAYAYISIIEIVLKLGVAFAISFMSVNKLQLYALMILAVTVIINLIYRGYCKSNFHECRYRLIYNRQLMYSMSGYAAWSSLGAFAWIGKSQGCNLILNIFLGPAVNAAYGITNQINTALNSFVQNFTTAVNPQIVKSYASADYDRTYYLVHYGCKLSFFLILVISVPILMTTEHILTIWLKTVPQHTVIFTRLIIVNSLFESFSYCMGMALQASGKIKVYQIVVGITILLNLPVAFITLKMDYPPASIFVVSIIISAITLVERLLIMRSTLVCFSIRKFTSSVFLPSIIVSVCILISYFTFTELISFNHVSLIYIIPGTMLMTILIVFYVGFNKLERESILNMIKSRICIRKKSLH